MKKVLFILAILITATACKKSNEFRPSDLYGKWELRRVSGGFGHDSVFNAGNGNIYQFKSDHTYKHFTDGTQDEQGIYQYKMKALPFAGFTYDALILNNDSPGQPATLNDDKLTVGTMVTDGLQAEYQKISD